ncbi:uncharacterized protein [Physcomitrium patens]|uniref:DNA mismatch repair proteins mutS family domain-containing protein n=2 Tax=Physcomitrium patens TaxID=3218 RepID=A0A2K1J115_PHYPA|nr:uncharacterized protein LOC112295183 isoform X2 [Physcomitrium patens]PNR35215.1 hypothetical protein PHYPA_023114 [Physcomitrium patens]|eukprot:XP_024402182.1 uncharacterized protein LOC112295183 isoform X2 [Physcomitrella patens]
MSQRWPLLHRRASSLDSMTAFRHTGLRFGAGKHLGKVGRNSMAGEVETTLRGSGTSTLVLSTMPCCLERLAPVPFAGSGRKLGFRGVSPSYCDGLSLGLCSLSRGYQRYHKVGGKSSRLDFHAIVNKVERTTKSALGSRFMVNARDLHVKHLRPFYFHGWPSLVDCSFFMREIDSRRLVRIPNLGSLTECVASLHDGASVDEDVCSELALTSNLTEGVVWEEITTSTRSLNDAERASESPSVFGASCEGFKEDSSMEGPHEIPIESQVDPTIIVFDIETTGFLKPGSKIVELACRDIAGGDCSTLETLVNPYQPVPIASTAVHKITSEMVNRDDIPSWTEVMTAFVDFVESRRIGNSDVILVAHNGRRFDVPFIMKECYECSMEIPSHWYFIDTIDLAKAMLKKRFGKTKLYNLQFLYYDCYKLPRLEDAHRAGVDVDMLASVFGKLLMELEMPVSELLDQAFKASHIELKPDLLLRENNDRYTSLSKEVDETLLEQSMVDVIICERNVDPLPDSKVRTLLEPPDQGQDVEAICVSSEYVETEESWESTTGSITLNHSFMSKDSTAYSDGTRKIFLKKFEGFDTQTFTTAQLSGDENPRYSEELSSGELDTRVEGVPIGDIQLDANRVHVAESLASATIDEKLLGLEKGTPALENGITSSWEDKYVLDDAQDNKTFEFEDALGLVLGNEEGLATSTPEPSSVNQVEEDATVTSSLVSGDELPSKYFKSSRKSRTEECTIPTRSPSTCNDDPSFSNLHPADVNPIDDLIGNENLDGLEVAQQSKLSSPTVGDGGLQPLNIGGTLLSRKKGKRRGTGDVQTTATRNIAHTVGDCEEQLSAAVATVINELYTCDIQPVRGPDSNDSSHGVQDEKQRRAKEQLHSSSVNLSFLSPMMRQYVETKRQRPKFLLLSRVGDFYEAFFEDAERLAHACNIRLSGVDGGKLLERKVPMAGVPYHKVDVYLRTLLKKGISVVKQDQVTAADTKGGTIIDRQVTAVLTPGTLLDEAMLEDSCSNFLVSIFPHADENGTWGLAYADISTGEFQATQGQGRSSLLHELQRLQPSEIIFPANVVCTVDKKTEILRPIGMPSEICYSSRPTSEFFPAAAEKRLHASFGEESLKAFGVPRSSHAIRAAGGLLGYIQETQKLSNEEIPLQSPSFYSTLDTMHMDDTVRKHLELLKTSRWDKAEGSLVWALDHSQTAMGSRLLRRWLLWPLIDHELICRRQDAVQVFFHNHEMRSEFRSKLAHVSDVERIAARIAWKRADSRDLLTLAQSIKCLPSLAELIEGASLNSYFVAASQIPTTAVQWANKVENMIAEELGNGLQSGKLVKEGVDPTLDVLRQKVQENMIWLEMYEEQERLRIGIPSLEVGFNKNSGHFISIRKNKLKEDCIPNDYQKLQSLKAEERFVTPELLNCESSLLAAEAKVFEREEELLRSLKEELVSLLEPVREYSQTVAALDVLCTFAELAVNRDYCRPHMLEKGREITIIEGRHPVVELSLPDDSRFVPNSVYLGFDVITEKIPATERYGLGEKLDGAEAMEELTVESEKWWPRADLVLLTGPNASGKSCYLRQLGLIQLIAQSGSFVPAKFARLSIADGVYTRVGAVDDLAAGQSTFRIEMVESANILNRATAHSLVLLDEVGRGTSSQEGGVIARAIIEYLSQIVRARTIFSTHYHDLHILDQDYPNVANYHFQATELDNGEVIFDHAVMPGYAIKSHAIAIGRSAGLPDWVCSRATELLALEEGLCASSDSCREQSDLDVPQTYENEVYEDRGNNESYDKNLAIGLDEVVKDANCSGEALASNKSLEYNEGRCIPNLKGLEEMESEDLDDDLDKTEGHMNGDATSHVSSKIPSSFDFPENIEQSIAMDQGSSDFVSSINLEGNGDGASESTGQHLQVQVEVQDQSEAHAIQEEKCYSREQLDEVWGQVYIALQNQPATQALLKQKGSLVSVSLLLDEFQVCVSASSLFVRKFQQPEHFATLESAFALVLHQPVHLRISARTDGSP